MKIILRYFSVLACGSLFIFVCSKMYLFKTTFVDGKLRAPNLGAVLLVHLSFFITVSCPVPYFPLDTDPPKGSGMLSCLFPAQ